MPAPVEEVEPPPVRQSPVELEEELFLSTAAPLEGDCCTIALVVPLERGRAASTAPQETKPSAIIANTPSATQIHVRRETPLSPPGMHPPSSSSSCATLATVPVAVSPLPAVWPSRRPAAV